MASVGLMWINVTQSGATFHLLEHGPLEWINKWELFNLKMTMGTGKHFQTQM
jgi:hypothetical protein